MRVLVRVLFVLFTLNLCANGRYFHEIAKYWLIYPEKFLSLQYIYI